MCLAVPGRLIERDDTQALAMGKVDFGGLVREVCLAYVPEAMPGQYLLVHVGFALSVVDEAEALRTLALLREAGVLAGELGESA